MNKIYSDWLNTETAQRDECLVVDIPKTIMLELTNGCNLKCIFCQSTKMRRVEGFMSFDLVKRIINESVEVGIERVALYTTGESLLHHDFIRIVEFIKGQGLYCYTTTNGLLIDESMAIALSNSGLDSIKISIDGANKETYEKIRIGGRFKELMRSLRFLKDARDRLNPDMEIIAGAVITKFNEDEIEEFRDTYGNFVDEFYLSPLVNQSGQIPVTYEKIKSQSIDVKPLWKPCKMLWDRIVVSCEGHLTACCVDYELDLKYGSLLDSSIKELWNGEYMQSLREKHLTSNVSDVNLCSSCNAPMIQQKAILKHLNKT